MPDAALQLWSNSLTHGQQNLNNDDDDNDADDDKDTYLYQWRVHF